MVVCRAMLNSGMRSRDNPCNSLGVSEDRKGRRLEK